MKHILTTIIVVLLLPCSLFAAGFDCSKARTKTEHLICDNAGLSRMDDLLEVLYSQARMQTKAESALKSMQQSWLQERNRICDRGDVQACEHMYIKGFQNLITYRYESLNPLTDGMLLPKGTNGKLDKNSIMEENEQPWKQKVLFTLDNVHVDRLLATVVDDTPYLVYLIGRIGRQQDRYEIHERNLLTGTDFLIAPSGDSPSNYVGEGDMFALVDGVLYYPPFNVPGTGRAGKRIYRYRIGTQQAAEQVAVESLGAVGAQLRSGLYAVHPREKTLAVIADTLSDAYMAVPELAEAKNYFAAHPDMPADYPQILVYGPNDNAGFPIHFNVGKNQEWRINSLVFHGEEPVIFFDNSGPMACIWAYNLVSTDLLKIIPQHSAKNPAPFDYQGKNFLAFSMENAVGSSGENRTVTIALAKGDMYPHDANFTDR